MENHCVRKIIFIFMLAKHILAILSGFSRGPNLFGPIWGQNLCTGATIGPNFLVLSILLFFDLFFLLFSSYSYRTILPLLFLLSLYLINDI